MRKVGLGAWNLPSRSLPSPTPYVAKHTPSSCQARPFFCQAGRGPPFWCGENQHRRAKQLPQV